MGKMLITKIYNYFYRIFSMLRVGFVILPIILTFILFTVLGSPILTNFSDLFLENFVFIKNLNVLSLDIISNLEHSLSNSINCIFKFIDTFSVYTVYTTYFQTFNYLNYPLFLYFGLFFFFVFVFFFYNLYEFNCFNLFRIVRNFYFKLNFIVSFIPYAVNIFSNNLYYYVSFGKWMYLTINYKI